MTVDSCDTQYCNSSDTPSVYIPKKLLLVQATNKTKLPNPVSTYSALDLLCLVVDDLRMTGVLNCSGLVSGRSSSV